jgi:hypothetical protein
MNEKESIRKPSHAYDGYQSNGQEDLVFDLIGSHDASLEEPR